MSWWTKNRKYVGLLGAAAAAVASGGTASPLLAGLFGGAAPVAGGTAAGTAGALGTGAALTGTGLAGAAGTGALIPGSTIAANVGTGLGAATTALPGMAATPSFMNAGLTAANGFGNMAAMSTPGSGLLAGIGKGVNAGMKGMQLANAMTPQPAPPPPAPPRPPMAPQAPLPVGPGYSPADQPPPGFDPNQWALMSPEQKKALMAQRGMA